MTFDVVASGHVDGVRASGGIRTLTFQVLKQERCLCLGGALHFFYPGGETREALDRPVRVKQMLWWLKWTGILMTVAPAST